MNLRLLFTQGGRGSGNRGHKGRPGKVGGSAPSSSSSRSKIPKRLYHYTDEENWKKIQKEGLKAVKDYILSGIEGFDNPGVNLLDDPENLPWPPSKDGVWLIIDTSKINHKNFWDTSEDDGGWFRYEGNIPASAVKRIKW